MSQHVSIALHIHGKQSIQRDKVAFRQL